MIDKETLLKSRLDERTITIDGVGDVRIRGLGRIEVLELQAFTDKTDAEAFVITRGFVDPALTDNEARTLLAGSPGGELQPVVDAIFDLSAMGPKAVTESAKSFRGGPVEDAGVPGGP